MATQFKIQNFKADGSVLLRAISDYVAIEVADTDIGGGTFVVTKYLGEGEPTPSIPATGVRVVSTLVEGGELKYEVGASNYYWLTLSGSTNPDIDVAIRSAGNE